MQTTALIVGWLRFPEGGLQAWRERALDPSRYRDWPEGEMLFTGPSVAPTVGALIDAVTEEDSHPSFFEAEAEGEMHAIAGIVQGDERVLLLHLTLLTALREAAECGASGTAALLLPAFGGGTRVVLEPKKKKKKSTVELGPLNAAFTDQDLARVFLALDAWNKEKARRPSLRRAEFRRGEASYWLDAISDSQKRALEMARALSDDALTSALSDPWICTPTLDALSTRFEDAAALRVELDAQSPLARVIAISLAAHGDAPGAEQLAMTLATESSRYLQRIALRSLGKSEAALDVLFAALADHPTEWTQAAAAIGRSTHASAAERLVRALDPETLVLDAPAHVECAARTIHAVVARADRAFVPRLLAIFDHPKMRPLVPTLVQALAALGGPEVEARGNELEHAMHGMGKALNQDFARRVQLLRLSGDDSGGIEHFSDLDGATVMTLMNEGFLHPESRQNEAPSAGQCLMFMQEWPETRASGYAVTEKRPDYRVMIDSLRASLEGQGEDRKIAMRTAFEEIGANASRLETTGDVLEVWWT